MKQFCFLIISLLLTAPILTAQDKAMQIHHDGSVVYEIAASQIDSITFSPNKEDCLRIIPMSFFDSFALWNYSSFLLPEEMWFNRSGKVYLINSTEEFVSHLKYSVVDIETKLVLDFDRYSLLVAGFTMTVSAYSGFRYETLQQTSDNTYRLSLLVLESTTFPVAKVENILLAWFIPKMNQNIVIEPDISYHYFGPL